MRQILWCALFSGMVWFVVGCGGSENGAEGEGNVAPTGEAALKEMETNPEYAKEMQKSQQQSESYP